MKRTIYMLSTLLVVFVAAFMVFGVRPAQKVRASQGCSNLSLHGNYQLVMEGSNEGILTSYPWDFSMLANFDGTTGADELGGFSGSSVVGVYNGEPYYYGSFTGGVYIVFSDCSVGIYFPSGLAVFDDYQVHLAGVISADGEALGIGYSSFDFPWTGSFDATKVGN